MKGNWLTSAVALLIFAMLLGGVGIALRDWVLKIGAEPQVITAAELIAKGPGENHYVRITECEFGPAVLDKGPNASYAYLPVYPRGGAAGAKTPPIIYRSGSAGDANELAAISRPPQPLEGVIGNNLIAIGSASNPEVLKAYPGLDPGRTLYLRQMDGPFREMVLGTWGGAGLCLFLGLLCLAVGLRPSKVATIPEGRGAVGRAAGRRSSVARYRGTASEVPAEVLALGPADHIHKPGPLFMLAREQPILVTGAGLFLVAAPMAGMALGGLDGGFVMLGLFAVVIVGVLIALLPFLQRDLPSYLVFPDALVEVKGDEFAVIPWDQIKELNAPRTVVTNDGQQFPLSGMVQDLGRLYDAVQSRLHDRLMPAIRSELNAGQAVPFGRFTLSRTTLGYDSKEVSWDRVSSMQIIVRGGNRSLNIWDGHILPWCSANLSAVPNDWLFLDALRSVCPPHLLVPVKG